MVALGGVLSGAAALTGRAITTRLSEQTARVRTLAPQLHMEEAVDRGLFRSTRTVKVRLGCVPVPAADGDGVAKSAPVEVSWRDTIHHVPFLSGRGVAVIDSELVVPNAQVEKLFGSQVPLTVRTQVGLGGQFESDARLSAFKLAPKPGDELAFSGFVLHVKGKLPDQTGKFSYSGSSEPLRLNARADDGSLSATVGKMELSGNALIDPTSATFLMPFESRARIADMTVNVTAPARDGASPTSIGFRLLGVAGTTQSKLTKELWSYSSHVQGRLETQGMLIDKFEMGSALRNLHAPTVTALAGAVLRRGFSCDQTDPLAQAAQLMDELAASANQLLPHNPEYQVGPVALELGGKRAELSYVLGIRGVAPSATPPPLMQLVMAHGFARAETKVHLGLIDALAAWAQRLAASTNSSAAGNQAPAPGLPDAGALMARAMIDGFVERGFLERDADSVRGRIEVEA
ncbi:MAG TPA: DUF945 family protein, partial [Polyangiales bacterium]|nr:DUF945 family protein [Polyangiales bacterium]